MSNHVFTRRLATRGAAGAVVGALAVSRGGAVASGMQPVATPASSEVFARQVDAGLDYFQQRAADQLPLVETLRDAIAGGELEEAKRAYVESRPPYEEIEVLAASFSSTDEAIDARPYAFDDGESSADFKGFHRIEALLYREGDLVSALTVAEELIESVRTLQNDLTVRFNFSAEGQFDGMVSLANEIASKKISSEEETWSDQSMLIFKHNWIGIWSQYEPYAPVVVVNDPAVATEVESAYEQAMTLAEPAFAAGTVVGTPYSQIPVDTRGQIVAASYRLRNALLAARQTLGLTGATRSW